MTKGKGQPQAYGDESYWDNRYSQDVGSFDWYQRYAGLAPLINMYLPKTENVLMVGCGNAVISEDMVNDGYQTIMNIDISQVVIDVMVEKYKDMPQLQYQRMDVRQLAFKEGEFNSVLDKGMFDSLMCGSSAPTSAASMIKEVRRVLKPGGVYMLITYGDPRVRIPHLKNEEAPWEIKLHVIPRPGSKRANEGTSRPITEPVPLGDDMTIGPTFNLEDPDLHYVYVCIKEGGAVAAKLPEKRLSEKRSSEKRPSKKKYFEKFSVLHMGQIYTKKLRKARNAEITEEKIISSKDSATLFVPTYVPKFGAQGTKGEKEFKMQSGDVKGDIKMELGNFNL